MASAAMPTPPKLLCELLAHQGGPGERLSGRRLAEEGTGDILPSDIMAARRTSLDCGAQSVPGADSEAGASDGRD